MDTESVCRCCLSKDIKLKSLSSFVDAEGQRRSLQEILTECLFLQTKVNDGYPQKVCIRCINQLENVLTFRIIICKSLKTFKRQISKLKTPGNKSELSDVKDTDGDRNFDISCVESHAEEDASFDDLADYISKDDSQMKQAKPSYHTNTFFYCTCCTDKFSEAGELYKHCCDAHPPLNNEGDSCEYCNELFPDNVALARHKKQHLNRSLNIQQVWKMSYTNNILCPYCGKSVSKEYYVQHIKIHQEKTYACKICGKKFAQLRGYKLHKNFHRSVPKYKCPHCDNMYRYLSGRNCHIRRAHNKEKSKICATCGKAFFCMTELNAHLLSHSGEKNHSCHLCGKAYQKKYGLTVHLKSHAK